MDELIAILASGEWRNWELAIEELKRRGHDLGSTLPRLSGHLVFGSKWVGGAARIALMNTFPETRPYLKDYRSVDDEPTRRKALAPQFAQYNVNVGESAV